MERQLRLLIFIIGTLICFSKVISAQPPEVTDPAEVGLSGERLQHLTEMIHQNIDQEQLAGAVVLIARHGQVAYLRAAGRQDREADIPMRTNTIMRIASMTKPITSVGVMMLYEEGHFRLSDPVADYIPAFRDPVVLADRSGGNGSGLAREVVPAERPITIRQLLTHTSGLTYQWDEQLGQTYYDAGITHGLVEDENTLAEDIPRLAKLPLLHQPGEDYTYGLSLDVLGYLVEVISGKPLNEFLQDRIFRPLEMHDTYFHVPESKQSRLSAGYTTGPEGGLLQMGNEPILENGSTLFSATYPVSDDHRYLSGGAGLCSTVPDYYRFAQMLLNGGELDGVRLLSPKTVELMTTDMVGDLREGGGFGLGFGITRSLAESGELDTVGKYYWGSFWYGTFFIDPTEDMIGISLANKHPGGGATLNERFQILAYQAVVD